MSTKPRIYGEDWIRATLSAFCSAVGSQVMPAKPQRADLLVEFLNNGGEFHGVRRSIAETKVALGRARRPGSTTRANGAAIEAQLLSLLSERQKLIAQAVKDEAFVAFVKESEAAFQSHLREWKAAQSLLSVALKILKRERIPDISPAPDKDNPKADPTIPVIVDMVLKHVEAVPPPGSLVLMGEEPLPSWVLFEPASAYATGLDEAFFTAAVRLAVAPTSERGVAAEAQGAQPSRDALVMRIGPDRRPLSEAQWRSFDDVLPFGARMSIKPIMPYAMPDTAIFSNLRMLLSQESWRSVRDAANEEFNGTCVMCGSSSSGEVRADWRFHEPPANSRAFGIQELRGVRPYCSRCATVMFPDPARMQVRAVPVGGYVPTAGAMIVNPVMRRLSVINRWPRDAVPDPLVEVVQAVSETYSRRSGIRWALNLKWLEDRNLVLNPEMVMHPGGWIMRKIDVPGYDAGESVHLTRIFEAAFVNSDGTRYFFSLPQIHRVAWATTLDAIWLGGQPKSPRPDATQTHVSIEPAPAGPADPDSEDVETEEGSPYEEFY